MPEHNRLFIKIQRQDLVRVKDKYPFLYLERGRLEIDDSSVKWIDSDGQIIRLPIATIHCLLLGPGTSITHDAVKTICATNCTICWVGEDSLLFYAVGNSPTSNTRNLKKQLALSSNKSKSLAIAKKMFSKRYPNEDLTNITLNELMGMEGRRVRTLYGVLAEKYHIAWKGRTYVPGRFELSDLTNQILSASNAALYGIVTSAIYSLGYSPHVGFIHSGSPLPFVYDLADLYKDNLCIDLAFSLTYNLAGEYNKHRVLEDFRNRVLQSNLLSKIPLDIEQILGA